MKFSFYRNQNRTQEPSINTKNFKYFPVLISMSMKSILCLFYLMSAVCLSSVEAQRTSAKPLTTANLDSTVATTVGIVETTTGMVRAATSMVGTAAGTEKVTTGTVKPATGLAMTTGFRLFSKNIRLEGSFLVKTIPELSLIRCAIECAQDQSHVAFNYNTAENSCELVAIGQNDTLSATLTFDADYSYYVNVNLPSCLSKPCLYGSRCVPTEDGMDYRCLDCLPNFSGKNCGDLSCETCFLKDNMLYKVFDSDHFPKIDAAFYKCRDEGMRLVMIKDENAQNVIQDGLNSLSAKLAWPQNYRFWSALHRGGSPNNFSDWYWYDENGFIDSYLGNYSKLSITGRSVDQCAALKPDIGSYPTYLWVSAPCFNPPNNTYLPFCQRDLNNLSNITYKNVIGNPFTTANLDSTIGPFTTANLDSTVGPFTTANLDSTVGSFTTATTSIAEPATEMAGTTNFDTTTATEPQP